MPLNSELRLRALVAAGLLGLVSVFAVVSLRLRWFNDDAFITFRYARHLAEGYGLVWNAIGGAPVEGSTSLAWTALNGLALRCGLDPLLFSHVVGTLCGCLGLILVFVACRHVLGLSPLWSALAPAMLFLQRQWVLLGVSGMETRAATLLLFGATLLLIREQTRERPRGFGSGALFLAASFVRPEAPLLHLAAGVGAAAARPRGPALRAIFESGAIHGLGLGLLTLWRLYYFGQPLPNTFYAKIGGVQLDQGLVYVWQFLVQNHAWLWGSVLLVTAPLLLRRWPVAIAVLGTEVLVWLAWLAVIGGGRWEFRLVDPLLPVIAVWVTASVAALATAAAPLPARLRRPLAVGLACCIVSSQVLTLLAPFRGFGQVISTAQAHSAARKIRSEGQLLARYLGPEDSISTGWAGTIPYTTGAWHLDPWGLNDVEIARRPFDPNATVFHQRHATWQDIVDNRVMFCDLFNRFLHAAPYDDRQVRMVVPWVEDGVPVYSVRLPEGVYWVFTSGRSRREIDEWMALRGLSISSMRRLPPGMPRP